MSSNQTDWAVRVEGLSKQYRIGSMPSGYQTLRDTLVERWQSLRSAKSDESDDILWALRNVSFDVPRGQALGIIGRNGAGKTTLLKILSRVTEPTEGRALIRGRVGALLEVGTGFHPELSGRENIYLNGAILGMRRAEIDARFDEIVAFADVERFIDTPIKRYSSGMNLRLAFSVAAHLEPEILVVDEVLAVGDAEFQRKCVGKMSDVAKQGRTVLFVSHDMSAILRLTQEAIVLDEGRIVMRAESAEAVDYYMTQGMSQAGEKLWDADEPLVAAAEPFRPISLAVIDHAGRPTDRVTANDSFEVVFTYELAEPMSSLRVGLYLFTSRGEPVLTSFDTDSPQAYEEHASRPAGRYQSRCRFPAKFLNEGRFVLGVNASAFRVRSYFTDEHALTFAVDETGAPGSQWAERRRGPVRPQLAWDVAEAVR
ncbi:MAG TPA: ABC transporter ATP-binding protein [Anaerolineales bacterium]|jgi:lipopolysaccharide transport system ATP-binding protein